MPTAPPKGFFREKIMPRLPILLLASCTLVAAAPAETGKRYSFGNSKTGVSGEVRLKDAPNGVLVHIEATGLQPGWHAVHFHEKADCTDPMFKSADGHVHMVTPTFHGLLNPAGNDLGDLSNIFADAQGVVKAELFSPFVALRDGTTRSNLLDADGSALVIHANADDYATQPIGGAGARVACTGIQ
ncbi:superoxide dismutase family protein [Sphingobium sp. JS3065]|uniref:superoxide dismutase family protein n=1 Tax=Sphingobium sp. JS3065 TaxID=2970925 RepID=UPI00226402F8|nr:superoxide dismutase family protein [Sphingobium sp. JS3065]UZW57345.1 superoxide dismutase family protein [Sphingobium sp. JS3065]